MSERLAGSSHWLIEGNPRRGDLKQKLVPDKVEPCLVMRYTTRIQPGDIVWFWRAVERALYGWGGVLEEPKIDGDLAGVRVPVRYVARFDPPIGLDDIRARSQLADLMVLRAPQGTNFKVTQAQASALIELIQGKGFMAPQLGFQAETVAPLVR